MDNYTMRDRHWPFLNQWVSTAVDFDRRIIFRSLVIVVALFVSAGAPAEQEPDRNYGIGTTPSRSFISIWDIAIGPQGDELPPGQGSVAEGQEVYANRCAVCHGATGMEGPDPVLVGGRGTLTSNQPVLTIGSYWAYATTLFDYIYRAMPFVAPGSLSANEVYALCAYLLHANEIVDKDVVLDKESLPAVQMPNRNGFVPDPRPEFRHRSY